MSTSKNVAIALMAKGILSRDQVDTAAEILAGPLDKMAKAEAAEKAALADEVHLVDVVLDAEAKAQADDDKGDLTDEMVQEHTLEEAREKRLDDEEIIEASEQAIDDAFDEAVNALVESKLIDSSQGPEVTTAIVDVWKKRV